MLFSRTDRNYFKSPLIKISGEKKLATSKGISLERIKGLVRRNGCSLNDFIVMSVIISLKEYSKRYHNVELQKLGMLIPNSLRSPEKIMRLSNEVMGYFIFFPLPKQDDKGNLDIYL